MGHLKWKHRLGFGHNRDRNKIDIWLHAASMGEVTVLKILTDQILKIKPETSFYITVMTDTGYRKAVSLFGLESVGYLPLDSSLALNIFLMAIKPQKVVIVETEIWFNLIKQVTNRHIPLFQANGRLTDHSLNSYIRIKNSMKKTLSRYSKIMVQTNADRDRFMRLGAESSLIEVVGNLKFDAPPMVIDDEDKKAIKKILPFSPESKILVCGSIRNDEFATIIEIAKAARNSNRNPEIIIVPRYLDKIKELVGLINQANLTSVLFSDIENNSAPNEMVDILIVDKMGILNKIYSISDIAVVGGTFDNMGGHNILEPVWAGIPVLFGPSYQCVQESAEFIFENGYGDTVNNSQEMINKLNSFFENKLMFKIKDLNKIETPRAKLTADNILLS
ncbi:MAG: glycosyltransferase N-terminal domain-containing protein [Candidatus Zixiibacteriota bacterium]